MAINTTKINTLLEALNSKNKLQILRDNIYIPFLGTGYSMTQLTAWLDKRIDFLNFALTSKEEDVKIYIDGIIADLNAENQDLSDEFLYGTSQRLSMSESSRESLVLVQLYSFITTE